MKIVSATYGGTFSTGNYENQKLSLSAQLEDGDTAESVITALKEKVCQMAGPSAEQQWREQRRMEKVLFDLGKKVEQAKKEWETAAQFLQAQGIKTDMPDFPALKLLLPTQTTPTPDAEMVSVQEIDDECEEDEDRDEDQDDL
jgi:hypothetical protein